MSLLAQQLTSLTDQTDASPLVGGVNHEPFHQSPRIHCVDSSATGQHNKLEYYDIDSDAELELELAEINFMPDLADACVPWNLDCGESYDIEEEIAVNRSAWAATQSVGSNDASSVPRKYVVGFPANSCIGGLAGDNGEDNVMCSSASISTQFGGACGEYYLSQCESGRTSDDGGCISSTDLGCANVVPDTTFL